MLTLLAVLPAFAGGTGALILRLSTYGRTEADIAQVVRPLLCDFLGGKAPVNPVSDGFMLLQRMRMLHVLPILDTTSVALGMEEAWRNALYRITGVNCWDSERSTDGDRKMRGRFAGIVLELHCTLSTCHKRSFWTMPARS